MIGIGDVKTIAVAVDTLSSMGTPTRRSTRSRYYTAALRRRAAFSDWDLATDPKLPLNYLKAFKNVVWFTGNAYPGP